MHVVEDRWAFSEAVSWMFTVEETEIALIRISNSKVCVPHCVGTFQKHIWQDDLQPYSVAVSHCFLICKETMVAPLCCRLYSVVCSLLLHSVQVQEIKWVDINLINCLVSRSFEMTKAFFCLLRRKLLHFWPNWVVNTDWSKKKIK